MWSHAIGQALNLGGAMATASDDPKSRSDGETYENLLTRLKASHPQLAADLLLSHEGRRSRLLQYLGGVRLDGIEEVLQAFSNLLGALPDDAQPLRMLVDRLRIDFVASTEAILSGNLSYALDTMRDVLEVELLFLDFIDSPDNASKWLSDSESKRRDRFQPAQIRKRLASHGKPVGKGRDYAGHSASLHPAPPWDPFGHRGLYLLDSIWVDGGFWDIFDHARRVLSALHTYLLSIGLLGEATLVDPDQRPSLIRAWERTQEMQILMIGVPNPELGDESDGDLEDS
jgi:hypothetical protein